MSVQSSLQINFLSSIFDAPVTPLRCSSTRVSTWPLSEMLLDEPDGDTVLTPEVDHLRITGVDQVLNIANIPK